MTPLRSDPTYVERMLSALAPLDGATVLEIGVGEGAVARALAAAGAEVVCVELDRDRAEAARDALAPLGIRVLHGDGMVGLPDEAPFDAIAVSARVPQVPPPLRAQLSPGGRLVATIGTFRVRQRLVRVVRTATNHFLDEDLGDVLFCTQLDEVLAELGIDADHAGPEEMALAQSLLYGIERGNIEHLVNTADPELMASMSPAFQARTQVVPIQRGGSLLVAVTDPEADDQPVASALRASRTSRVLLTRTEMERLRQALRLGRTGARSVAPSSPQRDLLETSGEGHAALFDALLLEAAGQGASDIHFERYGDRTRVRLRVDGLLHDLERFTLDADEHDAILRILEVSSGMDITEHIRPQSGRFSRAVGGQTLDLRAQVQPSHDGNNAVIRLLVPELRTCDDLGFPEEAARLWRTLTRQPSGLVLVTGPTGSGKTTTLYAALKELAEDTSRKVMSLEDPVEYSLYGIQQVQIGSGVDFANGTRSLVRQDPDVLFIGEIRDHETALEAVRASQTGHLVLTSLHCNDAPDAVQRLYDLGLHPNSIASELLAVLNQRLVRRLCTHCRGRGCPGCLDRGTRGRVPLVEIMLADAQLRTAIALNTHLDALRELAHARGLRALGQRADDLVAAGVISLEEKHRVLGALPSGRAGTTPHPRSPPAPAAPPSPPPASG